MNLEQRKRKLAENFEMAIGIAIHVMFVVGILCVCKVVSYKFCITAYIIVFAIIIVLAIAEQVVYRRMKQKA